jgi:hypothetical protein
MRVIAFRSVSVESIVATTIRQSYKLKEIPQHLLFVIHNVIVFFFIVITLRSGQIKGHQPLHIMPFLDFSRQHQIIHYTQRNYCEQ